MAYENGGRSDKYGNRFENNWVIYKLLDLAEETISYVLIEAIGDDEKGVDLWIGNTDGSREAQQCKARNRSEECWTYSGLSEKNILSNWKEQLSRDSKTLVSLVSPLSFTNFEDITNRARNTNAENADLFYEVQIEQSGVETRRLFKNICSSMNIDYGTEIGNQKAVDYFSRMYYRQRLINQFNDYIGRHHCTNKFSRELLDMCKAAVLMDVDSNMYWGIGDTVAKTIIGLYYNNAEASSSEQKAIVNECLDIWDLMYERNIGTARQLTNKLLEVK